MTPSERERRIDAAVSAMACPSWRLDSTRRAELAAALDAADEAVPVVPATWGGLLEHLDAVYPADVFTGEPGDVGARLVVLARRLAEAEAAARGVARAAWLDDGRGIAKEAFRGGFERGVSSGSLAPRDFSGLEHHWRTWCHEAGHPSFSGEEGTDG